MVTVVEDKLPWAPKPGAEAAMVTEALGTGCPVSSRTVPEMVGVVPCLGPHGRDQRGGASPRL